MTSKGEKQTDEHVANRMIARIKNGKDSVSPQAKKNMSVARSNFYKNGGVHPKGMLGKTPSLKNIEATTRLMKGNKYRLGISPSWKGKKLPWAEKLKGKRPQISGANHYNWQGGLKSLALQIRHSFKTRQWRSDVFGRDDFTCVLCETRGGKLNADHIKPFAVIVKENQVKSLEDALNCEELWDINNGRTLCEPCHRKTDNFGSKTRKKL